MSLIVEAKRLQSESDHRDRAWLAWTTAALHRAKRLPPLNDLIGRKKAPRKRRATRAEHLLTMANMWTAATGGKLRS